MASEVNSDFTGNTYNSVLTIQVVCAGVQIFGCLKPGELFLGTLAGVHLDSGDRILTNTPSSHHDSVLKSNSTSTTENEDDIYSN